MHAETQVPVEIEGDFLARANALVADLVEPPSEALIERLRQFAGDLDTVRHTGAPSEDLLHAAPVLSDWSFVIEPDEVRIQGLSILPPPATPKLILTSAIWLMDPQRHWIRTLSRFYRLGAPRQITSTNVESSLH